MERADGRSSVDRGSDNLLKTTPTMMTPVMTTSTTMTLKTMITKTTRTMNTMTPMIIPMTMTIA